MERHSAALEFEDAARIRDRIRSLERLWETQRIIAPELGDMDVIGLYREGGDGAIQIFFVRNGMLIGAKDFFLKGIKDVRDDELLMGFLEQFYNKEIIPPEEVIVPVNIMETDALTQWLSEKRGGDVSIRCVDRGKEKELVDLAVENASMAFKRHTEAGANKAAYELKG